MPVITYTLVRGDEEIDLEVDYTVEPLIPAIVSGPPGNWYPAEGGEIESLDITGPDGREFETTAEELREIEQHIYDTHDYYEDA